MVDKHIMPDAMVAEICIANPDATSKDGFVKWLQYEAAWPLPQYLIDNIVASWDHKTYRSTMESDLAFYMGEQAQAVTLIAASLQRDTTISNLVDSLRATWQILRTPVARYSEILTYLQQDNFDSAMAVMDRLPIEYKLKDEEVNEKDRTKQFISIIQNYRNAGRTDADLSEEDLYQLKTLRDGQYDHAAIWAENLLCFVKGDCREPLTGGEEGGPAAFQRPVDQFEDQSPELSAYPNPAGVYATIAYDLKTPRQDAYFVVRDIVGKEVARFPISIGIGELVWDTRTVAPGSYTIEMVNDEATLSTVKLIVKR